MKRKITGIQKRYLLTFYFIFSFLPLAAQNCCDNPDCTNTAKKYAEAELQLLQILAESPGDSLGRVEYGGVFQQIMNTNTLLCFTAISLQTGKTTVYSTKNIPASPQYEKKLITSRDMFIKALLGGSNQAGFLPPVTIDNEQYVDGGNREVLPTEIIPVLKTDQIIAVSNNPRRIESINAPYDDILKVLFRAISIFIQEVRENDIEVLDIYRNHTGADYLIFEPDRDLDPEYPTGLRFDQRAMAAMITKGELTAELILSQNPNFFSLA